MLIRMSCVFEKPLIGSSIREGDVGGSNELSAAELITAQCPSSPSHDLGYIQSVTGVFERFRVSNISGLAMHSIIH